MRVGIRADASVQIGTGHIRRCLELARELADHGAEVRFVWRDLGLNVEAMTGAAGFASSSLPRPMAPFAGEPDLPPHGHWAEVTWRTDAAETISALSGFRPEVLIVDHYAFDHRWHQEVRNGLGCKMAALDDLGDRPLDVELIVDHNYCSDHRAKHRISEPFKPRILGGPTYALLSAAYRRPADLTICDTVRSVGIFMGGADPANHSAMALDAARQALGAGTTIEIATTSANPNLAWLQTAAGADTACTLSVDLPDLAAFFGRHDLQIGAGGGATWERCCIGAPTVAIAFADNHRPVLSPLDALGVLAFSSRGNEDAAILATDIAALASDAERRRDMSARARALVDGLGLVRVGEAINALFR
ncbi:UDP-2,4-diacetamido-2,4,6-trideoxy-beta-L-altropyranose hydrolase [Phenylobacterium sp.]|uniref:UDP-2,4-diacetamido-2,4, 6-trideoxy-beta-L-altropyranose hydrolase n=1 Tax=Phenylobacterium sp. TaxID=1871053 RepID=UPI002810C458|nr:UDP-2,4-diacetamido-2,4,6-trideoxy-beta-L-altropyranose hydrolase [Phenylobacterium sp.]